ncbi:MAG: hypothetical protein AABZ31_10455 [Bdellovibrionota bacterium]
MGKRMRLNLADEACELLNTYTTEANAGFKQGRISKTDVLNEIILSTKVEIDGLRAKHIDVRKSLRLLSEEKQIDVHSALHALIEIKNQSAKANRRETKKI